MRLDRSFSAGVPLLAPMFADADWNPAGSLARLPDGEVLVLRGGVKLCEMPKKVAGVPAGAAGAAAALLVKVVGVALTRLMARVTALTCFLPAL